jgi:Xaa-Pro aminopeptidase
MTAHDVLRQEVNSRVERTQKLMRERGYDVLIVYANNKLNGSVRYLTDYYPDRTGWISLSPKVSDIMDGAAALLTQSGSVTLFVDAGLHASRDVCVDKIVSGDGFVAKTGDGLSTKNLKAYLDGVGNIKTVGIETFSKFPAPLFLDLKAAFPSVSFVHSTVVEELRLIKSPFDVGMLRQAAMIGDLAHTKVEEALRSEPGITELALIRVAEATLRKANPIYEDTNPAAPCLICSGYSWAGALLHMPSGSKTIERGDVVHWDLTARYQGYPVDTSRTRVLKHATDPMKRAYDIVKEIYHTVVEAARPGIPASELVAVGNRVAKKYDERLWNNFIGHGIGWDVHERPDMGVEETPLEANMVLAIEPRLSIDDRYLMGIEDMVLVTETGGEALTHYPFDNLEIRAD